MPRSVAPRSPRRAAARTSARSRAGAVLAVAALVASAPGGARAQMAGVPLLQSAFLRPGLAGGINVGGADDGTAVGAAIAWGVGGERFAVAAGVGSFATPDGYASPAVTFGTRLAVTAKSFADGRIALTPFAGVGRTQLRREAVGGTGGASAGVIRVPAGVSVGYRRAVGTRGTLAVLAAPMYAYSRPDSSGAANQGVIRLAVGAELGLATGFGAIGVTAGFEGGQSVPTEAFGPRGTAFGLGLSVARGRGGR